MAELTTEQQIEMRAEKRRLHETGEVSRAMAIGAALEEGRYFMGVHEPATPELEAPKPNAKKQAWIDYALAVSDIDPEVLDGATRKDIAGMLRANGLID